MRCRVIAATLICMAVLAGIRDGALAETVDLLLVLVADVSRSTDDEEFNLQRKGYANAITDPEVLSAIMGGKHHAIAVTFVEWSGADEQKVVVDSTVIHDGEAAAAMASAIMAAPRSFVGRPRPVRRSTSPFSGCTRPPQIRNGASSTSPATAPPIPADR